MRAAETLWRAQETEGVVQDILTLARGSTNRVPWCKTQRVTVEDSAVDSQESRKVQGHTVCCTSSQYIVIQNFQEKPTLVDTGEDVVEGVHTRVVNVTMIGSRIQSRTL